MDNKLNLFYQSLSEDRNQMSLVTDELQKDIKKARMLPFNTAVEVMPRMVRDLAQEEGKDVRLEIEGGEVELDKNILEKIKDPLIHLIRNAVDHGIEPPEERKKKGKPLEGAIAIRALQQGDSIVIDIEDDGNGIQTELVKKVALKRNFLTAKQLEKMTEHQVLDIIFQPGFSTSKILTDVSGRGVGMDVVLAGIAKSVVMNTRELDTVARYGGEEFAVILPQSGLEQAEIVAEKLRQAVERQHFHEQLKPKEVTISIGIDAASSEMNTISDLIASADAALYSAKEQGRNRVVIAKT